MTLAEDQDQASTAEIPRSLAQFVAAARAFLESQPARRNAAVASTPSEGITLFEELDPERDRAELERSQQWQAVKFDAGFGWIMGAPELGGLGLPVEFQAAFDEIASEFDLPGTGNLHMGLTTVAPAIDEFGTAEQRHQLLPAIRRGDVVACQLFSEPGAGSDLAAIATRAEPDGTGWVLSGQKVWTSAAQQADIGEIICRTDPSVPKHRGLTAFLVDMRAPGIEVRPLRQMTGGASFNEVFLDGVTVPDSARLGPVGAGWQVVMYSLNAERATIQDGQMSDPRHLSRVLDIAGRAGRSGDAVVRQALADLYIHDRVAEFLGRLIAARTTGAPGPELALTKLALGANHRRRARVVSHVLGVTVTAASGWAWPWSSFLLSVPAITIAGGSDEILRTMVGERVLGLPKEPTTDSKVPFADLPS